MRSATAARAIQDAIQTDSWTRQATEPAPNKPAAYVYGRPLRLMRTPIVENAALQIYGRPEGVDVAEGLLAPIVMKDHRDVNTTDRLELAFYWLLLEPHRAQGATNPHGFVYVRGIGTAYEQICVPLRERNFERVRELIKLVRAARQGGVEPRQCACDVCLTRQEVAEIRTHAASLSLLSGVGWKRARALEQLGATTLDELLCAEAEAIAARLKALKHFVSAPIVQAWKHHAYALRTGNPV